MPAYKEETVIKRYDKRCRILKTAESKRIDGYYQYWYIDQKGKIYTIMTGSLEELR